MTRNEPPKRAVVLTGGGANGAFEIGVLKALVNGRSAGTGFVPTGFDVFSGTSVGAFNASYLSSQWDTYGPAAIAGLERLWLDRLAGSPSTNGVYRLRGNPLDLLDPNSYVPNPLAPLQRLARDSFLVGWQSFDRCARLLFERQPRSLLQALPELFDFSLLVSTEPMQQTIRQAITFDKIRASQRQLRLTATNWTTGELRVFSNPEMTQALGLQAIMASAALPGFFPPVAIGAEPYVDGGVLMNTPLEPAITAGADELHVIYLDPAVREIPFNRLSNTLGTFYRMQTIWWASTVNRDVAAASQINEKVEIVRQLQEVELPSALERDLARLIRRGGPEQKYRLLTVHRYHPSADLGGGAVGLLDFERNRLEKLIELGFEVAENHDCKRSGCIVPELTEHSDVVAAAGGASRGGGWESDRRER